jgi:hypothetical protein
MLRKFSTNLLVGLSRMSNHYKSEKVLYNFVVQLRVLYNFLARRQRQSCAVAGDSPGRRSCATAAASPGNAPGRWH